MATQTIPQIQVQKRDRIGSRYAARLRDVGRLPAVIYGHKLEPLHVSLDRREMTDLLHENAHLLEAQIDGHAEPVLIKEIQWDHLGALVMHVDLERVDLTEEVTVDVALRLIGEAVGLKEEGAVLSQQVTQIEVRCLATNIPHEIKVDVSHLKIGETVTAGQVKFPEGVKTTLSPEAVIATISVVREEIVEPVAAEGATGTEPEIIGKKAEEGAEGDAAAPAAGAKAPAAKAADKGGEKKK